MQGIKGTTRPDLLAVTTTKTITRDYRSADLDQVDKTYRDDKGRLIIGYGSKVTLKNNGKKGVLKGVRVDSNGGNHVYLFPYFYESNGKRKLASGRNIYATQKDFTPDFLNVEKGGA